VPPAVHDPIEESEAESAWLLRLEPWFALQRVLDLAGVEPLLVWSEPPAEFATDAI